MIAVLQRTRHANVEVDGKIISEIKEGLLILLGISIHDTEKEKEWLATKISQLRIFSDENGKMNKSILDLGYEALVVSQFTLLADASQGNRPSYIQAARPELAIPLYESFCNALGNKINKAVKTGIFGADMKVNLLNDGPVTIVLDTEKLMKK